MKRIIIDTNAILDVLSDKSKQCFNLVKDALLGGKRHSLVLIKGGTRMATEYGRIAALMDLLAVLDKAGRLLIKPSREVDNLALQIARKKILKSDDEHVIALAQISGSKILISYDTSLQADFVNIIRGNVYKNSSHEHLLRS